ncbi:MAG: GT4 family glycosyltransferase PelF [Spirochaetales bacterium]|nr:GT4 family glycosyltransferase PelF [Spirochaetales bacterium]
MDDVCIIVESIDIRKPIELPRYVTDLITTLNELRFAVVFITPKPISSDVVITSYPGNLNTFINICLDNSIVCKNPAPQKKYFYEMWKTINQFYRAPLVEKKNFLEQMIDGLAVDEKRVLSTKDIIFSKQMWNLIIEDYRIKELHIPFVNYYKIFYSTQGSLFQLMNAHIPRAKLYHVFPSLYTVWAAFIAKRKYCTPFILDERDTDAIATFMDVKSNYLAYNQMLLSSMDPPSLAVLHDLYAATCDSVEYLGYSCTDMLITQFAEQQREERDDLREVMPKMVQIQAGIKFSETPKKNKTGTQKTKRFLVGLIGRFIPEDDIKTFIRACNIVAAEKENVDFKIFGLEQSDETYLLECKYLRNNLDLALRMEIINDYRPEELWNEIDVLVSTSLDKGHYNFLLEAMSSGIPLVATNRGVHAELIHGDGTDDTGLGECGFLTDIGNPEQIALAVLEILKDKKLKASMGKVGKKRIENHYSRETNFKKYLKTYQDYL